MKLLMTVLVIFLLISCSQVETTYVPQRTYEKCFSIEKCAFSIEQAIIDNWSRPESAKNHMKVMISLTLDENFSIIAAKIDKSSGDLEYDEFALKAANLASPFVELAGLDKSEYVKTFSSFKLLFDPIDLSK